VDFFHTLVTQILSNQHGQDCGGHTLLLLIFALDLKPPASSTTKNPPLGKRDERSGQGERGKKDERSGGNCGGFFGRAGEAGGRMLVRGFSPERVNQHV